MKKKFGLLMLTGVLTLAACAPVISTVQGTKNTLTASAVGITYTNNDAERAVKVVLAVDGPLSVPGCAVPRDGVSVCKLGDVPAGSAYTLPYSGKLLDASATWRTPSGTLRAVVFGARP